MMIAPRARLAFYYSCAALLLGLLLTAPVRAQNALSGVLINEILADPNSVGASQDCSTATTPCFDTNGSGAAEADDEFVELFNTSGLEVDISGWEIYDETGLQHTFPGTVDSGTTLLAAGGFVVVVSNYDSPPANFFEASSGSLSLNNGAETVYLRDPGTDTFIAASYNGDTPTNTPAGTPNGMFEAFGSDEDGQSIQRRPDGSTTFVTDTPNPAATNGGEAGNAALVLTTVVDRADAVCSDPNDIETCNLSSSSSSVTAAPGEKVVVRYTAENTGDVTLTTHDLVDTEEGVLLSSLSFDLAPGATVFVDNFSMALGTLGPDVRTATWTAEDDEGAHGKHGAGYGVSRRGREAGKARQRPVGTLGQCNHKRQHEGERSARSGQDQRIDERLSNWRDRLAGLKTAPDEAGDGKAEGGGEDGGAKRGRGGGAQG